MTDVTYALESFDGNEWTQYCRVGDNLPHAVSDLDMYLSWFPESDVRLVMLEDTGELIDIVITVLRTLEH